MLSYICIIVIIVLITQNYKTTQIAVFWFKKLKTKFLHMLKVWYTEMD